MKEHGHKLRLFIKLVTNRIGSVMNYLVQTDQLVATHRSPLGHIVSILSLPTVSVSFLTLLLMIVNNYFKLMAINFVISKPILIQSINLLVNFNHFMLNLHVSRYAVLQAFNLLLLQTVLGVVEHAFSVAIGRKAEEVLLHLSVLGHLVVCLHLVKLF